MIVALGWKVLGIAFSVIGIATDLLSTFVKWALVVLMGLLTVVTTIACAALSVVCLWMPLVALIDRAVTQIKKAVDRAARGLTESAREAAIDAALLCVLGGLIGLIAYLSTGDVLLHGSELFLAKMTAISAIAIIVLKIALYTISTPVRRAVLPLLAVSYIAPAAVGAYYIDSVCPSGGTRRCVMELDQLERLAKEGAASKEVSETATSKEEAGGNETPAAMAIAASATTSRSQVKATELQEPSGRPSTSVRPPSIPDEKASVPAKRDATSRASAPERPASPSTEKSNGSDKQASNAQMEPTAASGPQPRAVAAREVSLAPTAAQGTIESMSSPKQGVAPDGESAPTESQAFDAGALLVVGHISIFGLALFAMLFPFGIKSWMRMVGWKFKPEG